MDYHRTIKPAKLKDTLLKKESLLKLKVITLVLRAQLLLKFQAESEFYANHSANAFPPIRNLENRNFSSCCAVAGENAPKRYRENIFTVEFNKSFLF